MTNPETTPAAAQGRRPATPADRFVSIRPSLRLHVHEWAGQGPGFVLLHGLASNKRTWERTAAALAAAGQRVVTVDQRGHGLSDKPDDGYDFATICEDLALLLDTLEMDAPIVAGQSWGGNVVLEFGARSPGRARGLVFVDGGIMDLQGAPNGAEWEQIAETLRPPSLIGTPREQLKEMIAGHHVDWEEAGIEATLANFETLSDGTVRPWLTLERHMRILRALWEQRPGELYPRVQEPVLIAVADDGLGSSWAVAKHHMVEAAQRALPASQVQWFHATAHDIHIHRPLELASLMLNALRSGFWNLPERDVSALASAQEEGELS
jgi:pimeloyl-ACP methyl ester carboxylesterase